MIDSTNPRILADNIRALQSTVTAQEDAIEAIRSYSETEVNTGMKYGNDDIYRKIIKGKTPTTETASVSFSYSHILAWYGTVIATSNAIYDLNRALSIYISTNAINIAQPSAAFQDTDFEIIILYTKAAPSLSLSPAPDDTRSIESEEIPEVREEVPEIEEEPVAEVKKTTTRKKTTTTE